VCTFEKETKEKNPMNEYKSQLREIFLIKSFMHNKKEINEERGKQLFFNFIKKFSPYFFPQNLIGLCR
jgi:hypothetical protein